MVKKPHADKEVAEREIIAFWGGIMRNEEEDMRLRMKASENLAKLCQKQEEEGKEDKKEAQAKLARQEKLWRELAQYQSELQKMSIEELKGVLGYDEKATE